MMVETINLLVLNGIRLLKAFREEHGGGNGLLTDEMVLELLESDSHAIAEKGRAWLETHD